MCDNINTLNNKDYIVFGLNHCHYTQNAIKLLKDKKYKYSYYNILSFFGDKELFKDCVKDITNNYRTFPMIFYKNKFIGGYKELNIFLKL